MTTAGWLLAVAVIALTMTSSIHAMRWWRYVDALREYDGDRERYARGLVTLHDCVSRSRRLMETQLAMCPSSCARVAAVRAHVDRTSQLIWQEESEFWQTNNVADLAEAKQEIEEYLARTKPVVGRR